MRARAAALPESGRGRWIPWAFVAFFGVVLAVNATMIVIALTSWPGLETKDAYQRGLGYNRTIEAAADQAALGWRVDFAFEPSGERRGVLRLDLADRLGNLLQDAAVRAAFVRPIQDGYDVVVDLPHHHDGRYLAEVELPLAGQWEVRVQAVEGGHTYRLRDRIYLQP